MEILKDSFELKGLHELDEIEVLNYLKETSTNITKNRNILVNNIFISNDCFNDYLIEVKCNQQKELTKFKAIIKDLNRRIDRGDF